MNYVYLFEEGNKEMKSLLGGKGANLAEMTALGISVPAGFIITTEACAKFYKLNKKYPNNMWQQVEEKLNILEQRAGKKLGDVNDPLLVSVRSGAAVSMPGMMDTILNLGLNDSSVRGLAIKTSNERFAYDSYRRFIQMFANVVMNISHSKFEQVLENVKSIKEKKYDSELDLTELKEIISQYKKIIRSETGKDFPQEPKEQLRLAINAVFDSWNNQRAITYRKLNDIKGLLGTAISIQQMVFGNMGETSGTGVAFSRNPSTGENKIYGEFLMNAQGEDVVAGIRTPKPITELEQIMPDCYKQFIDIAKKLEQHYKDMQDMEFTIQEGKLFFLQTREGKRTAASAVQIVVDMVNEGAITKEDALLRIEPSSLNQLLHLQLDLSAKSKSECIAKGLPASPGAAVGEVVFTAERAHELAQEGRKVILVRTETSPEDIEGMNAAQGILTARGGMTSHAAVVARGMGKCCVVGCSEIIVDEIAKQFKVKDKIIKEGDVITLDGAMGEIYEGKIPVVAPELHGSFQTLMQWADEVKKLKVKANADTPKDTQVARNFGAEGIGLCRTEHMFFEGERIKAIREMILAEDETARKKALNKLLPYQKIDFKGLFKVMDGLPVIIRLLDPPLHEFLPKEDAEIKELAREMNISEQKIREKIESLHEFNPMLGFRGCRLGLVYPEINAMQARAIFEAALEVKSEGITPLPEIEVPLVGNVKEFLVIKNIIENVAKELDVKDKLNYKLGTMIELPRACVTADKIAKEVDFLSFGTNDLTQTTLGFSRDDSGTFIPAYLKQNIFERDPFQSIDQNGVGALMQLCVKKARKANKNIQIGICGEHGGDPSSVEFCHKIGLNDVSCSPYRVPIAKLAAAQAVLKNK